MAGIGETALGAAAPPTFVLRLGRTVAESYRGGRFGAAQRVAMSPLRSMQLSADEHRQALVDAGYSDVRIFEQRDKGWICCRGFA